MTQPNQTQSTADLIAHTLDSLRAASEDLSQLAEQAGGINALVHNARGTALVHDLRLEINRLNKLLPFKS